MSFEEKIDAMRMTLELAMHDLEAQRAAIEAQRAASEAQREASEAQRQAIQELRMLSTSQHDSIQLLGNAAEALLKSADRQEIDLKSLKKITGELVKIADSHDRRIGAMEGRA